MNLDLLYSVEREFDSSIDDLWDAWVNPQKLEIWYHPTDLSNVEGLTSCPPPGAKAGMESYFDSLANFLTKSHPEIA